MCVQRHSRRPDTLGDHTLEIGASWPRSRRGTLRLLSMKVYDRAMARRVLRKDRVAVPAERSRMR
jgi:hypothetical protein